MYFFKSVSGRKIFSFYNGTFTRNGFSQSAGIFFENDLSVSSKKLT